RRRGARGGAAGRPAALADARGGERGRGAPARRQPPGHGREPHAARDPVHPRGLPGRARARGERLRLTRLTEDAHRPMTTTAPVAPGSTAARLRRSSRARMLRLLLLLAALVLITVCSVTIGSRDVGPADILAAFTGSTDGCRPAGVALGVSGAVMQGVTRNPLADPGILGINTGAALAVVVGIAWFGLTAASSYIWVAILGAALTAVLVYTLGSLGQGGATPLKLALAGAATGAALTSFISAVVLPRSDIGDSVRSWQIG